MLLRINVTIAQACTMKTGFVDRNQKSGKAWTVTFAVVVCVFLALYGFVGLDNLLLQARQSLLLLPATQGLTVEKGNVGSESVIFEENETLVVENMIPEQDEDLDVTAETSAGVENGTEQIKGSIEAEDDACAGRYIYVYNLPPQFNKKLAKDCSGDPNWPHMCQDISNHGFGEHIVLPANDTLYRILLPHDAWYKSSQFSLGVAFHERLKLYPCLTEDPARAVFSYLPFYTALDVTRNLYIPNMAVRDKLSQRLIGWLANNEHWVKSGGQRHVLVLSRIIWDYTRREEATSGWGNALLHLPEIENVTKLSIERAPWRHDQMALPYPTSFHPKSVNDIKRWQTIVRRTRRDSLVVFVGAPRRGTQAGTLRGELMKECESSSSCYLVSCWVVSCVRNPEILTRAFLTSVFCLQPPGDSPTRKGVFDSLVAGCIPVFFQDDTALTQYIWHLPANGDSFSVTFDGAKVANGTVDVIRELRQISKARIRSMQTTIRESIMPQIIYRKPGKSPVRMKDAFDVAIDNLLQKFRQSE